MNSSFAEQSRPADSRVVLCRGNCEFTVEDVLAAGWFLGDLESPWRELLRASACEERATELEVEAEEETLTSMSEDFRYERELLTVEEIERWLAARDLTEDGFNEYLVRRYWRENPPESLSDNCQKVERAREETASSPRPSPPEEERERISQTRSEVAEPDEAEEGSYLEASPELRELLRAELLLSGKFDRLARAVSWRLVLSDEGQTGTDAELLEAERARFFERTRLNEASLSEALKKLGREPEWLEECLQMEARYRQVCATLLTDEARARILTTQRLLLTRVKIEMLTLRSRDAAQEAVLCLKEKLLSKEELAKECRASWEPQEFFLGDCEPEVQHEFISAVPGEVLAPKPYEEGFVVSRIEAKTEPDLTDAQIRARIDKRLLTAHFSELTSKSIRWVMGEKL